MVNTTSSPFQGWLAGPGCKLSRPAVNLARTPQGLDLQSRSRWTAALTNGHPLQAQVKPVSPAQASASAGVFASFLHLVLRFQPRDGAGPPTVRKGPAGTSLVQAQAPGDSAAHGRAWDYLMEAEAPLSPHESPCKNCDVHKWPSMASMAVYCPLHGCSSYRHGEEGTPGGVP